MQKFWLLLAVALSITAHAQDLTKDELNRRLSETIATTIDRRVVLDDVLGEGTNSWDADPRYPKDTVNCLIWLQLLAAETYGKGLADKTPVLDKLRYFGGHVSFGTRKHYTDHWLSIDPGPFKPANVSQCTTLKKHHVDLDYRPFLASRKYSCPLYQMQKHDLEFEYVDKKDLARCAKTLPSGYYVLFAVPTDRFLKRTIKMTGPMGLVHAMVLKLREYDAAKGSRPLSSTLVYHASTAASQVQVEPLEKFLGKSKTIHQGYAMYEFDPAWDYRKPTALNQAELQTVSECEKKLPPNSSH